MFVNRCGRRRLQAAVGPGHGRRRTFGSPDHDHGRDSEVADTGRNRTRRDRATDRTARDPATDRTARDDHSPRHVRREAIPHATSHRGCDPETDDSARDEPYRTRRAIRDAIRHQTIPHATILFYPHLSGCSDISGYIRICLVLSGDARSLRLPGRFGTVRYVGMRAAQRSALAAPPDGP